MLTPNGAIKNIGKPIIIIIIFSLLNGIIIFIKGYIRYNQASLENIKLRKEIAPDFFDGVEFSLLLVSVLYIFFRLIFHFRKINNIINVWLMCVFVLMFDIGIIYLFGSMAGNMFSLKVFLDVISMSGINFFIPLADKFFDRKFNVNPI